MKVHARLKRLERQLNAENKKWVVFSIRPYDNAQEEKREKRRLIDDYLVKGNDPASCYLFINEIP